MNFAELEIIFESALSQVTGRARQIIAPLTSRIRTSLDHDTIMNMRRITAQRASQFWEVVSIGSMFVTLEESLSFQLFGLMVTLIGVTLLVSCAYIIVTNIETLLVQIQKT